MIGEQFMKSWLQMPDVLKESCKEDSPYLVHSDFFRFFCCYLAFNHLYDCNNQKSPQREPFLSETKEKECWKRLSDYDKKHWKPSNRERILYFVDKALKRIKHNCGYKPEWTAFVTDIDNLLLKPVVDSHIDTIDENKNHPIPTDIEYNEDEHELVGDVARTIPQVNDEGKLLRLKMQMVFLRIYQVRCNLFHGGKDPNKPRDVDLVKASADVLEQFLWFIVSDCHGEIW